MRKKSRNAFTLVELLVVISIIAMLLSVLLPALQKAKQQSYKVRCGANFHQIYLINQLYANDFKQWIPRWVSSGGDPTAGIDHGIGTPVPSVIPFLIKATLFDYLKKSYGTQSKFWVCPGLISNNGKLGFVGINSNFEKDQLPEWGSGDTLSYYLGIAKLNGLVNMTLADPTTVEESSTSPLDGSRKVLAADLNIKWEREWNNLNSVIAHLGPKVKTARVPAGGNRVQADGSVKWIQPSTMAKDNTSVSDTRSSAQGKFKHWAGHGRDYYW
jgi:prepilin-type N-terminal cleavage/methylation domain-containing protein